MKTKIPHTLIFLACFIVIAAAVSFRNASVPVISDSISEGNRTVIIDSGHGGADGGCVGVNGCVEKDINLAIATDLQKLLELSGFNVIMTRTEDVSIHDNGIEGLRNQKVSDMENRLKIIQSHPDALFISIHQNQYTEPQYFGAQMFYTTNNPSNFKLAQTMQQCFRELQPNNDREIKLILTTACTCSKTRSSPLCLSNADFCQTRRTRRICRTANTRKRWHLRFSKG